MKDVLDQTVKLKTLFTVIAICLTLTLSGASIYWSTKVTEAVRDKEYETFQLEFTRMLDKLIMIENVTKTINSNLNILAGFHDVVLEP